MIHYFTGFYGPVWGWIVIGIICVCLGAVVGLLYRNYKDRKKL